jgi:hypothetical protein
MDRESRLKIAQGWLSLLTGHPLQNCSINMSRTKAWGRKKISRRIKARLGCSNSLTFPNVVFFDQHVGSEGVTTKGKKLKKIEAS